MSGYAEGVFSREGIPERSGGLLMKPLVPDDLLRKIREVLDRKKLESVG
jgi:hypothetical protein